MNRKQAERRADKWLMSQDGMMEDVNSLANLFLRIDKAAYKRGVKDGENNIMLERAVANVFLGRENK